MALKRITKEYADLSANPPQQFTAAPINEDLFHWNGILSGPAESPYSGGSYKVDLVFPADYPFKPPKVKFITKVYHPNIDEDGAICLDILKSDHWKPSTKIIHVMESLIMLLDHPNPEDSLVASIAEVYNTNRDKFNKTVKQYVEKYAKENQ